MKAGAGMEMVRVKENARESARSRTLFFRYERSRWGDLVPGQFLMVWIPGLDEIPMSVSYIDRDDRTMGITVQNIGEATSALCSMDPGSWMGVRGPYGNGFRIPKKGEAERIIGVSGGVGAGSTILALEEARSSGMEVLFLLGARTGEDLIFKDRAEGTMDRVSVSTDDGSVGHHGFITDLLRAELQGLDDDGRKRTIVMTCGPEVMMAEIQGILEEFGVGGQFSLERFMKCGIGVCDSCSLSGKRVCVDGPVFTGEELIEIGEFGSTHRDRSGKSVPIEDVIG